MKSFSQVEQLDCFSTREVIVQSIEAVVMFGRCPGIGGRIYGWIQ